MSASEEYEAGRQADQLTDLSGRVAVVTGAAAGLGRAEAIGLARAGATVIVNDIDATLNDSDVFDEIKAAGSTAVAVAGDVSQRSTADQMMAAAEREGGLDIVVNNAGITRDRMLFNMTDDDWDLVINVHLRGHFLLTRNAATYWRSRAKEAGGQTYGRLINTSSEAGLSGPVGQANYGAAKAGVASLTVIAARELDRYGVTVNAIAPTALTRMTEDIEMMRAAAASADLSPEAISPLVVWLGSAESREVTGRVFGVWGNAITVLEGWVNGPGVSADTRWDPAGLSAVIPGLVAKAAPNADTLGNRRPCG